jgi:hypothetical protein
LLWHGTRGENIIGILHTGFRIAPADSRRTGAMFGEGVYFSDVFNKSANYAFTGNLHRYNQDVKNKLAKRYVFLCEVALGKMKTLLTAQNVQNLPNMEFQSVMGYGKTGPNPKGNIYLPNGCIVPLGKLQTILLHYLLKRMRAGIFNTTNILFTILLRSGSDTSLS